MSPMLEPHEINSSSNLLMILHLGYRVAERSDEKMPTVEVGAKLDPVHFTSGTLQKKAGQVGRTEKAPKGPIQRPLNKEICCLLIITRKLNVQKR